MEIGCGPGKATISFARQNYKILSIELSERLVALATKNCRAYPEGNILNMAFEAGIIFYPLFAGLPIHIVINY